MPRLPFFRRQVRFALAHGNNSPFCARRAACIRPHASGGGGPRSCAVEGARAATLFLQRQRSSVSEAPSTSLRVVPLPRFAGADKAIPFSRCTFASELCLHASRKPFPNPPSKKGGRRSADKRIHQSPPRRRKTKPASVCGAHRRSSPATRGIQSGGTLAFR